LLCVRAIGAVVAERQDWCDQQMQHLWGCLKRVGSICMCQVSERATATLAWEASEALRCVQDRFQQPLRTAHPIFGLAACASSVVIGTAWRHFMLATDGRRHGVTSCSLCCNAAQYTA
jgi:hypothetical protein